MKKNKKMFTMVGSLALVGAVAVGATLAYLSDNTGTIENKFTLGSDIEIKLDETDINNPTGPRTEKGNEYLDMQSGVPETKDPMTTVIANSNDCYVFMKVEGAQDFLNHDVDGDDQGDFEINNWSEQWVKVLNTDGTNTDLTESKDGYYVYSGIVEESDEDTALPKLFTEIMMSNDVKGFTEPAEGESLNPNDIKITSYAIQVAGFADNEEVYSQTEAVDALNALLAQLPTA